MNNLKGAITCLETANLKPNYSELGRVYGVDRRTAKKMYYGVTKKKNRNKESKLDKYIEVIKTKLSIAGTNKKAVYMYIVMNIDNDIGSYSNFRKYVNKHKDILIPKKQDVHPRFETDYGKQLQFDWKGPITLHTRGGDEIKFYVFSTTLSASRMHTYEVTEYMTRETVERCLINCFIKLGGVSESILTDNMSSIVNYSEQEFVSEFKSFCKDMGITPKKCRVRRCETKGKVENCNKFVNWILPYDNELFQIEKEYLKPLPPQEIIDHYIDKMIPAKVSNESLVYYKGTKYSVSPKYINQTVKLQEVDNKLLIYYNMSLIANHTISNKKIQYNTDDYVECLKITMPYKDDNEIEKMANENLELLNRLTK